MEQPVIQADADVLILGAGAAGLMAALAARGGVDAKGAFQPSPEPRPSVRLLDGSSKIGLKILVSGGGRCNVTNEHVSATDYDTDAPRQVGHILKGFSPRSVRNFFEGQGCPLYAEPFGKLFPQSNRARDVLTILMDAVSNVGAPIVAGADVIGVERDARGFVATCRDGASYRGGRLIVATGGKSLPKTGSRGFGLDLAARLGHELEPAQPALTPLFLAPDGPFDSLAGVTVPALLSLVLTGASAEQVEGRRFKPIARSAGSLLITHRGASGPAALDVSGPCGRALAHREPVTLEGDLLSLTLPDNPYEPFLQLDKPPGASLPSGDVPRPVAFEPFRRWLDDEVLPSPKRAVGSALAGRIPRSLVDALLTVGGIDPTSEVRTFDDGRWRRVHRALVHADLKLIGTDGYQKAEVTAGGVRLADLIPSTLESRHVPGLHFCGEVCHVTGRLGGFNFQWAWSSGFAAGRGAAAMFSA